MEQVFFLKKVSNNIMKENIHKVHVKLLLEVTWKPPSPPSDTHREECRLLGISATRTAGLNLKVSDIKQFLHAV